MGLDVGQVLSRALSMFRSRLGSLVGLWLVFFVIQIVATLIFSALTGFGAFALGGALDGSSGFSAGFISWIILFYVMYLLIYCAQSTSMSAMASPLLEPSFGDSFGKGIRTAPTLLAALILMLIAYFIVGFIASLLLAGVNAVSSVLGFVFGIVLLLAFIYLACRLAVISPVIGVEQTLNPITALTRTWAMTRGKVLGIFLTLLVFIVGVVILGVVIFYAGLGGILTGIDVGAGPGVGTIILLVVVFLAFGILLTVLGAALISSLHEALSGHDGESLTDTFG